MTGPRLVAVLALGTVLVGNWWLDPEAGRWVYAVADEEGVTSPRRLLVETLADWLGGVAGTTVFAASGKDRSAVLLGGHRPEGVFWYDRATGRGLVGLPVPDGLDGVDRSEALRGGPE